MIKFYFTFDGATKGDQWTVRTPRSGSVLVEISGKHAPFIPRWERPGHLVDSDSARSGRRSSRPGSGQNALKRITHSHVTN